MAIANIAVTITFLGIGAIQASGNTKAAALDTVSGALPDSTATSWVRVGRWMSQEEYANMKATGVAQESWSSGGSDVALPANPNSFGRQAKAGSLYVEYEIPSNTMIQDKGNGWAIIQGPNSVGGRNAARSGRPVPQLPPVRNIELKGNK